MDEIALLEQEQVDAYKRGDMATVDAIDREILRLQGGGDVPAQPVVEQPAQQQPQQRSAGDLFSMMTQSPAVNPAMGGLMEAGAAIGSAAGAGIGAGYAGMAQGAFGQGSGADKVEQVQQDYSYQPRSEEGKQMLQGVGNAVDTAMDVLTYAPRNLYAGAKTMYDQLVSKDPMSYQRAQQKYQQEMQRSGEQGLMPSMGDDVLSATGSPTAATATQMLPEMVESIFGLRYARVASDAAKVSRQNQLPIIQKLVEDLVPEDGIQQKTQHVLENKKFNLPKVVDGLDDAVSQSREIVVYDPDMNNPWLNRSKLKDMRFIDKNQLNEVVKASGGSYEDAAKKLYDAGFVAGDQDKIKAAIKLGIPDDEIAEFSAMSAETRNTVKRMLDKSKRLINATRTDKDANRILEFAGESLNERFVELMDIRKERGRDLNKIVKERLVDTPVDTRAAVQEFELELNDLGINITRNEQGLIQKDAKGNVAFEIQPDTPLSQATAKSEVAKAQMYLNRMLRSEGVSAQNAHMLKKDIQQSLDFGKDVTSVDSSIDKVLKNLQRNVNESIRAVDPEYAQINDDLSAVIDATNRVAKHFGKLNYNEKGFMQGLGVKMRKLQTNYESGGVLRQDVDNLDNVARALGLDVKNNIKQELTIARMLEDQLDLTPRGTFKKQVSAGASEAVTDGFMLYGDPAAASARAAAGFIDRQRLKRKSPQRKIKALEDLLQ